VQAYIGDRRFEDLETIARLWRERGR